MRVARGEAEDSRLADFNGGATTRRIDRVRTRGPYSVNEDDQRNEAGGGEPCDHASRGVETCATAVERCALRASLKDAGNRMIASCYTSRAASRLLLRRSQLLL